MTEGHHTVGCQTGFRDLDAIISGFQPSNLVILAARPSMGKTAFALNIARNVAVDQDKGRGHLQPGDVQDGSGQPDDVLRGPGGQLAGAPGDAAAQRVEQAGGRLHAAAHRSHLHRRQRLAQPHGDPGQGPAPEGQGEEPGPHRRRLPAAHDGRHQRREPAAGDLADLAGTQDPGPRAGGAGAGAVAALAAGGAAGRATSRCCRT